MCETETAAAENHGSEPWQDGPDARAGGVKAGRQLRRVTKEGYELAELIKQSGPERKLQLRVKIERNQGLDHSSARSDADDCSKERRQTHASSRLEKRL